MRGSVIFHGKLNLTLLTVSSCQGRMDGRGASLNPCSAQARSGWGWGQPGWGPSVMSSASAGGRVGRRGQGPSLGSQPRLQLAHSGRLMMLLSLPAPSSTSCPAEESWWSGLVIIIAVCCASLVFLTVLVIICYKAIKR